MNQRSNEMLSSIYFFVRLSTSSRLCLRGWFDQRVEVKDVGRWTNETVCNECASSVLRCLVVLQSFGMHVCFIFVWRKGFICANTSEAKYSSTLPQRGIEKNILLLDKNCAYLVLNGYTAVPLPRNSIHTTIRMFSSWQNGENIYRWNFQCWIAARRWRKGASGTVFDSFSMNLSENVCMCENEEISASTSMWNQIGSSTQWRQCHH